MIDICRTKSDNLRYKVADVLLQNYKTIRGSIIYLCFTVLINNTTERERERKRNILAFYMRKIN